MHRILSTISYSLLPQISTRARPLLNSSNSGFYNRNNSLKLTPKLFSIITTMKPSTTKEKPDLEKSSEKSIAVSPEYNFFEDDDEELNMVEELYKAAKEESSSKWLNYMKTCYIYLYRGGGDPSSNLAAFDLDGTIIKPKSNKRIPKNATDWQLFSVWTKVKLQQVLKENNSRFVIFTNQNGVGLKLVSLEEVQERIELVTKRLNIPCTVFVATEKDKFRKPEVGMFKLFERSFNADLQLDYEKSFYCGDAIGYPSHSDADIKFSQTLALPFLTPEKFLRGVKPKLVLPSEPVSTG